MYTGKDTECTNGLAYGVVMHLLEDLQEKGRVLYVDNFTSPLLFEDLFERGTYASVTVRVNHKHFPTAELDEAVVERGSMSFRHHGAMTAGKWRDKRDVYFLSTLYRDESEPVNRRAKEGETETVNKPKIVTDYNQYMSGVDIADQLMCIMHVVIALSNGTSRSSGDSSNMQLSTVLYCSSKSFSLIFDSGHRS